jgi:hypothetical protein
LLPIFREGYRVTHRQHEQQTGVERFPDISLHDAFEIVIEASFAHVGAKQAAIDVSLNQWHTLRH